VDTKKRSAAKSITWRVVGILILGGITYAFTGSLKSSAGITIIFNAIRLVLYYWHERIWEKVEWGRVRHPLAHYEVRADLTGDDHEVIRRFLEDREFTTQRPEYEI
jgi:uncharacterized membrane protein